MGQVHLYLLCLLQLFSQRGRLTLRLFEPGQLRLCQITPKFCASILRICPDNDDAW